MREHKHLVCNTCGLLMWSLGVAYEHHVGDPCSNLNSIIWLPAMLGIDTRRVLFSNNQHNKTLRWPLPRWCVTSQKTLWHHGKAVYWSQMDKSGVFSRPWHKRHLQMYIFRDLGRGTSLFFFHRKPPLVLYVSPFFPPRPPNFSDIRKSQSGPFPLQCILTYRHNDG